MALRAWYDDELDGHTIVSTPEELDRVLDVAVEWGWPAIVELFVVGKRVPEIFGVGVHGKAGVGMLYYGGGGGWHSLGDETKTGTVLYYYMNADTETPLSAEIPLDAVRRAAHEFMGSGGERPASVDWQPSP